jgi:hypothetical protein
MGIGDFPWGQNNRGVKLTTHCHLLEMLGMSRAVPPFPPVCLDDVYRNNYSIPKPYGRETRGSRRGTTGSRGTQSQYYCPIQPVFKIHILKHSELCHLSYVVLTGRRRWHW